MKTTVLFSGSERRCVLLDTFLGEETCTLPFLLDRSLSIVVVVYRVTYNFSTSLKNSVDSVHLST